jgi:putative membrane protein
VADEAKGAGGAAGMIGAQRWWIGSVGLALVLAQINQPYPDIAPLQHIPTLILLLITPWLLNRWPVGTRAVAAIAIFFLIHTFGGRYTYSNVPYDDWSRALFNVSISDRFGWTRNHYDRLVHFAFGVCAVIAVADWLATHKRARPGAAVFSGIAFVLSVSCLYEIFEWMLTLVADHSFADGYNGQQGDIWDAQKDMAIAAFGATIGAAWLLIPPSAIARRADGPGA